MHRNVGLDWAQDSLRVATLQSGFRGFAVQDVRSALLLADGTPAMERRSPPVSTSARRCRSPKNSATRSSIQR